MSAKTDVNAFFKSLLACMDECAGEIHGQWLASKQVELEDPSSPFRGLPPEKGQYHGQRVRVRDLSVSDRHLLGITENHDEDSDVFHPLFMHYEELDTSDRVKGKNALPVWVLINVASKWVQQQALSFDGLKVVLEGLLDPKTPADQKRVQQLTLFQHIAWGAGEIVYGARTPGTKGVREENPHLVTLDELGADTVALDQHTLRPAVEWVLNKVKEQMASG